MVEENKKPDFSFEELLSYIGSELAPDMQVPLREPDEIDLEDYAKAAGISRSAAQDRLDNLVKLGKLTSRKARDPNTKRTLWVYRKAGV